MLYKNDWSNAKKRYEAFWRGEIINRVAIRVISPIKGKTWRDVQELPRIMNYRAGSNSVVAEYEEYFSSIYWGGEALPCYRANFGPMIMSVFLGCPLHFSADRSTSWQKPIIDSWGKAPSLITLNSENKWWQLAREFTQAGVERGKGRFFVIQDLSGGLGDFTVNIRGVENLCLDLTAFPEKIREVQVELLQLWFQYYGELRRIIQKEMEGSISWMQIWSPGKTEGLSCDFSALISSKMFEKFFIPEIEAQARWLDNCMYHLDGPDAIRHLDRLLEIPEINGIQWVPGDGSPKSPLHWLPMLKKIQKKGKLLYLVYIDKKDIEPVLSELSAKGLLISTRCDSEEEAKLILQKAEIWTARNLRRF